MGTTLGAGLLWNDRAASPRLLWRAEVGRSHGGAHPQNEGDHLLASGHDGSLVVLQEDSGACIERHPSVGIGHHNFLVKGPLLYFSSKDQHKSDICAYHLPDERLVWVREVGDEIAVIVDGTERVIALARNGMVMAIDKNDGAIRWHHRLRRPSWSWSSSGAVVGSDSAVYICAEGKAAFGPAHHDATEGYVLALDSATGDIRWMYCTLGESHHPPVLQGSRIYIGESGSHGRGVHCLSTSPDSRLGGCLWRYDLGGLANHGAVAGDTVYWGCYDNQLYALDAKSGALRWQFKAQAPMAYQAPPSIWSDWVFVTAQDGFLYGLSTASGALRWKYFFQSDDPEEDAGPAPPKPATEPECAEPETDEEREQREWSSELDRKTPPALQSEDERDPSPPGLTVWNNGRHLFLLSDEGSLHCFQLPGVPS